MCEQAGPACKSGSTETVIRSFSAWDSASFKVPSSRRAPVSRSSLIQGLVSSPASMSEDAGFDVLAATGGGGDDFKLEGDALTGWVAY